MTRRSIVATLLLIIVAQLAGGIAFATICSEPCPDDGGGNTCPPVCSLCTSCTHAQQAIVRAPARVTARNAESALFGVQELTVLPQHAADILHVPLLG